MFVYGLFLLASCREEQPRGVDPVAHNQAYDIWPDSIDLHDGVILRAMSDSLMLIRVNGNDLDSITAGDIPPGRMTFSSSYPLLDFLYRLEASCQPIGRYSATAPYEIYLNPLQNDSAMIILSGKLKNGHVIPSETRTLGWPTINTNAEWLLAATELSLATGDSRWEKTTTQVARAAIDSDTRICRNPSTGLFTGIPRYMASAAGIFPSWMETPDIFRQSTLAVNVAYAAAMSNLGLPTDSLTYALKKQMWIPDKGYLGATSYGLPVCQVTLQSTDNLAQAVAVLSGILPDAMSDAIIRKTPTTIAGVSLFQPSLPPASGDIKEEIPSTLIQSAWAVAAARRGNEAAYSTAIGSLLATEGKRLLSSRNRLPSFRSTFTVLITRGLLGIRFLKEGLSFNPYVPENLPGEKSIGNLRYRDALLDIKITGTGNVVSTFTIDGQPSEPFIPATLEGRHQVAITLAGASADPGFATIRDIQESAPLPPVADWTDSRMAVISHGEPSDRQDNSDHKDKKSDDRWQVYVNGILHDESDQERFRIHDIERSSVIQFTTLDKDGATGFSNKPHIYLPRQQRIVIKAPSMAKSGTKILENKQLASKFVESNRFKNRNISFDLDVPESGCYLVEIHYANGLGIVNSQRKVALRSLRVNNHEAGILVFPQLSAANAPRGGDESWQEMTAWSNALAVNLDKGTNHLELRYFQPSPVYSNPNSNVILFDNVRLTPVN